MQRGWTCLATVLGLLAANGLYAADSGPEPVFTNKVRFRIPFRYDTAEMDRLQAREVQLHVSSDHGVRWRMGDKVDPHGDHFDFVAPGDGEYWFAVRTLDAFNRFHPQGNNIEPGLKVIVDTTPPVLELVLNEIEPGKVELRWVAADDHLDPTKLHLEYRQPDLPDWQQVAVVPGPNGQTAWAVPAGGVVAVRGTISDAAGNSVSAEKEVNIHPAAQGPQKGSDKEYRAPVASAHEPTLSSRPMNGELGESFPLPSAAETPKGPAATGGDSTAKSDQEFFNNDANAGPRIQPKVKDRLVSDSPTSRPEIVQKPQLPLDTAFGNAPAGSASTGNASTGSAAGSADEFATSEHGERAENPTPSKNAAPRTVVVRSQEFQIGYRVDDVGPSGVGKVELFITQDGGQKWYRYGTDPDKQSPFQVRVPADGEYGFELHVMNGAGIGDDPPRPGDKPSIVVTVDKTPPAVQFLPPQVGRGNSRNKVLLRWTASDANLGSAPILLEYAAQSAGPWQKIGDWQANSGRFVWTLEPRLPGKVFLRLTAKDEAGNVSQSAAAEPLVIDFARPTARIVDVEAKSAPEHRN